VRNAEPRTPLKQILQCCLIPVSMRGVARLERESASSGVGLCLSAWQSMAWRTPTNLLSMTLPWTQVC
jgi:hypothetical protein